MQTYDLSKFALARSNGSSFLLITQYEMPFINKSEATKRLNDQKINGKSSVQMARTVGVVFGLSILFNCDKNLPAVLANSSSYSRVLRHTHNIECE